MTVTLFVVWVWATDAVFTQEIEIVGEAACQSAKDVLEKAVEPLIIEGGYLVEARFDCLAQPGDDLGHHLDRG